MNTTLNTHRTFETAGSPIKAWTVGVEFEAEAEAQLRRVALLPFIHKWVAVMPDVHSGIGATVGSVIATKGAIIPAAVGVDIGCGMVAVRTTLTAKELPHSLAKIRSRIERDVPVGFDAHPRPFLETEAGDRAAALRARMQVLHERYRTLDAVRDLGRMDAARVWNQLGTL